MDELKELLEQEMKKTFNKISKERYQWGNRMLRKKKINKLYRKNTKQKRGNDS